MDFDLNPFGVVSFALFLGMHRHTLIHSFTHSLEMRWKCVNILWIVANCWTANQIYYGGRQTKHTRQKKTICLSLSIFASFPFKWVEGWRTLSIFFWVIHKIVHLQIILWTFLFVMETFRQNFSMQTQNLTRGKFACIFNFDFWFSVCARSIKCRLFRG